MAKRKDVDYVQCGFRRKDEYYIAWIPDKFAQVDRVLKFKMDDGTWDDGWVVIDVGDIKKSAKEADSDSQTHKKHRDTTDI